MSTTVEAALIALAGVVIAPVITVVLAGLSGWSKQRSERRDRDHERRRVLTQVREEIDVIEAWVKAYELVAPPELRSQASSRAQNQLEVAYARLAESLEASREVAPQKTFREYLKIYLKGPQPQLSRHPVWRKTYLWLISIIGMIACTTVLASTLVPSTGRGDQPAGAVLGVWAWRSPRGSVCTLTGFHLTRPEIPCLSMRNRRILTCRQRGSARLHWSEQACQNVLPYTVADSGMSGQLATVSLKIVSFLISIQFNPDGDGLAVRSFAQSQRNEWRAIRSVL